MTTIDNRAHLVRRREQAAQAAVAAQNSIQSILNRNDTYASLSDLATIAREAAEAAGHVAQVQAFDVALAALDADRRARPGIQIGHGNTQINTFGSGR